MSAETIWWSDGPDENYFSYLQGLLVKGYKKFGSPDSIKDYFRRNWVTLQNHP